MLSHPLRVRSVCRAGPSRPNQLRRNFFRSFFSRRFLRSARKSHATKKISPKTKSPLVQRAFVSFAVLGNLGAGEGARTLDPDLGKAVTLSPNLLEIIAFSILIISIAHALPKSFQFR